MKTRNVLFALSLLVLAACSGPQGTPAPTNQQQQDGVTIGNGAFLKMSADLTDAESLTSNVVVSGQREKKKLFKLTYDKKLAVVLDGEHELISYKLTPTHIIARVEINEQRSDGKYEYCSLVAIPKVKGKSKVLCLNRDLMGCQHFESRPGYDVRGSEVFFTHQKEAGVVNEFSSYRNCYTSAVAGESGAAFSELRRWDGQSEKVETLFHTEPQATKDAQLFLKDVFASTENGNLCVETHNDGDENVLCRAQGTSRWERMKDLRNGVSNWTPYLKHGNYLLSEKYRNGGGRLDLATLEITERTGELPRKVDFTLDNGGYLGRNWIGKEILEVDPEGNSKVVLTTDLPEATPARVGSFVWYIGTKTLRRFRISDGALEEKDYFSATDLLRASSIAWALNDLLQIEGTTVAGQPGRSFLNNAGELALFEGRSVPLEHPITLQWDR